MSQVGDVVGLLIVIGILCRLDLVFALVQSVKKLLTG